MSTIRHSARRQAGFSLATTLFLLLVLSAMGVFMLHVSNAQQIAGVLDLNRARAYWAAKAGIEYGLYQVLQASAACAGPMANLVFADGSLDAFTATVACGTEGPICDGGRNVTVYTVFSTACNHSVAGACPGDAAALDYAERQLRVVFSASGDVCP